MQKAELTYVVISEFGTNWTSHVDLGRLRVPNVLTILQRRTESPQSFAERVCQKLNSIDRVTGVSMLCSAAADRYSVEGRRRIVDACIDVMRDEPERELSLVCPSGRDGRMPQWALSIARLIEERDPALLVGMEPQSVRAA